jgi:hypothetical protein
MRKHLIEYLYFENNTLISGMADDNSNKILDKMSTKLTKIAVMKYLCLLLMTISLVSCYVKIIDDEANENITACGIKNPQKNLPWLSELIQKGETDKTLNYMGSIWLEKYNGQDVFVTNMGLGSGGLLYHFFDCEGKPLIIEGDDNFNNFATNMKLETLVYSNFHF